MSARIIAITQPLIDHNGESKPEYFDPGWMSHNTMTAEEFIAYVARVSNPSNQSNTLTATKLLAYLLKHKHFSPFEMVNIVIEINTTRDIGRQMLRHEGYVQEFSQRYADPTQDMGFITREARLQDHKNRQNSIKTNDQDIIEAWEETQKRVIEVAKLAYDYAISMGIAKEQARTVLPEGLTMSRMYWNKNLRDWLFYCHLRMKEGTQLEHMEEAKAIWDLIVEHFPTLKDVKIGE